MKHRHGIIDTKSRGVVTVILSAFVTVVARHVGTATQTFVAFVVDGTGKTIVTRSVFGPIREFTRVSHGITHVGAALTGRDKATIRVVCTGHKFGTTTVVDVTITIIVDTITTNFGR